MVDLELCTDGARKRKQSSNSSSRNSDSPVKRTKSPVQVQVLSQGVPTERREEATREQPSQHSHTQMSTVRQNLHARRPSQLAREDAFKGEGVQVRHMQQILSPRRRGEAA